LVRISSGTEFFGVILWSQHLVSRTTGLIEYSFFRQRVAESLMTHGCVLFTRAIMSVLKAYHGSKNYMRGMGSVLGKGITHNHWARCGLHGFWTKKQLFIIPSTIQ
jgi:hypothetical protein